MSPVAHRSLDCMLILSGKRCNEPVHESMVVVRYVNVILNVVDLLENVIKLRLRGRDRDSFYCQGALLGDSGFYCFLAVSFCQKHCEGCRVASYDWEQLGIIRCIKESGSTLIRNRQRFLLHC